MIRILANQPVLNRFPWGYVHPCYTLRNTLHWTQMADGHFRLVSGGRWPFGAGLNGQQILKFEFDDHLIFYNLMFGFQFQRNVNYCSCR